MLRNGNGVLHIEESKLEVWNELLSKYYETDEVEGIIKWTYDNCIFGLDYN